MYEDIKVTVFMSCYNHEKFVAEAMESILNQTHKNLELIVINDGSEDNSAEMISLYQTDKRVLFYNLQKNTGAIGAFKIINTKIQETDSVYVAAMSSDDKWDKTKLEKQIAFLETHNEYKACFTWDKIIFENGHTEWTLDETYSHVQNRNRFQWFEYFFWAGNCINACSMLMDRMCYIELGGMDFTFRQLQDFRLWLELAMKYPFYVMPEQLTYYRRHKTNLSSGNNVTIRDYNERFFIWFELLTNMTDDFFLKCFRRTLLCANATLHEEVLAEKILMLIQSGKQMYMQIGFMIYMQNSNNQLLLDVLESKYHFSTRMFHEFMGNAGIVLESIGVTDELCKKIYNNSSLSRFLDMIDENNICATKLAEYNYNIYQTLQSIAETMNDGTNIVNRIRERINIAQDALQRNNSLCIIYGEEINKEMVENVENDNEGKAISICYCPNSKHMYTYKFDEKKETFRIFDGINHRIRTLAECRLNPDEVILLGCYNEKYPVSEILESVSLGSKLFYVSENGENITRL